MKDYLDPEEKAYTSRGAMLRRFVCKLHNTDYWVSGHCGIPDTFFSIPGNIRIKGAYIRGYVGSDENGLFFQPYKNQ